MDIHHQMRRWRLAGRALRTVGILAKAGQPDLPRWLTLFDPFTSSKICDKRIKDDLKFLKHRIYWIGDNEMSIKVRYTILKRISAMIWFTTKSLRMIESYLPRACSDPEVGGGLIQELPMVQVPMPPCQKIVYFLEIRSKISGVESRSLIKVSSS